MFVTGKFLYSQYRNKEENSEKTEDLFLYRQIFVKSVFVRTIWLYFNESDLPLNHEPLNRVANVLEKKKTQKNSDTVPSPSVRIPFNHAICSLCDIDMRKFAPEKSLLHYCLFSYYVTIGCTSFPIENNPTHRLLLQIWWLERKWRTRQYYSQFHCFVSFVISLIL